MIMVGYEYSKIIIFIYNYLKIKRDNLLGDFKRNIPYKESRNIFNKLFVSHESLIN